MYKMFSSNSAIPATSISATDYSPTYNLVGSFDDYKMEKPKEFDFQLSSLSQLDVIDKLRDLGVGDLVALPQLIVVGDHGKSSVLEALLELPFARDSGLCTRFATQITMRRTSFDCITISIIPAATAPADRAGKLRAFKKEGLISLNGQEFLSVFQEACNTMNLTVPGVEAQPGQTTFSDDVLKIELCGPHRENLTIIDLPGIFRTPTEGLTTKADMQLVENMVRHHIEDERTIILAVLPAPTDIATQSILTLAEEADPQGIRTLGVLTKPDLVDKGAEQNVIDLIKGKRNKLKLGYCIVRNRGQAELSTATSERSAVENSFFHRAPWSAIDKNRVGVSALKQRLQELLVDITRREFPKVKAEIEHQLASCKASLAGLGPDRQSPEQQRKYLQEMATMFQKLTDHAIDKYYSRSSVFDENPALRLPTLVVNRNDMFAEEIANFGHSVDFRLPEEPRTIRKAGATGPVVEAACSTEPGSTEKIEHSDLSDLLPNDLTIPPMQTNSVINWIKQEYLKSRGYGIVSLGPDILPKLWQQQSRKWEVITHLYVKDILFYVHDFIVKLLQHVCPDERTRVALFSILFDHIHERYQRAIDHVNFIIRVERFGTPLTLNHYYAENVEEFRIERLKKAMEKVALDKWDEQGAYEGKFVQMENIPKAVQLGNMDQMVLDIHCILRAYYKVARKRFVDNICMQGTDHHLLSGDDGPLRIFSPMFITSLTGEQLEAIAGEDESSKHIRKALKLEIRALEDGKKLLRTV